MRDLRIIFGQVVALTLLVGPVFAGNESNYRYLALGDSVSFGLDRTNAPPPPPERYIGYPEIVADAEHLLQSKKEVNASCPGQTSASFLWYLTPDFHCQEFKASVGLHTNYSGNQVDFAVSQLLNNKHINLVTLSIGGNDLVLLEQECSQPGQIFPVCVTERLPGVLQTYAQNLVTILGAIRNRANYDGTLVLLTYYVPNTNPLFISAITELNTVMTAVGTAFGAKLADGFGAFQLASLKYQGDPCNAGLLVKLPDGTCDVHPSPQGQKVLAGAVLSVTGGKF